MDGARAHVPSILLLADSAAGTAEKVANSVGLFRASFTAYPLEATCDIVLNVLLFALLRPISRTLALLALCFGLMATSICVAGELLYLQPRSRHGRSCRPCCPT